MAAMVRLVIVAHAPLASALHEVARHVYPELADQLQSLDRSLARVEAGLVAPGGHP
jgi:hypothetical protein